MTATASLERGFAIAALPSAELQLRFGNAGTQTLLQARLAPAPAAAEATTAPGATAPGWFFCERTLLSLKKLLLSPFERTLFFGLSSVAYLD
ncbi:hypothetical protein V1277_002861 [Bradyrhizobium sp. AZCC 1588]|uniref:hypothetical protein n=1 Tax=unclassified Bradyrhizobium TaxID=2631580 RepID=UPI002FEFC8C8